MYCPPEHNRYHFKMLMVVFAGSQISYASVEVLSSTAEKCSTLITSPTSDLKTVRIVNASDDVEHSLF